MIITLPHPHPALNPNGNRACWQSVATQRRKARELAAALTQEALDPAAADEPLQYNTYEIEWNSYGYQQADDDNIIARCKSYKDGICDALGINDRNLQCAGVRFYRKKAGKKTLQIVLSNSLLLRLHPETGNAVARALRRLAELDKAAYAPADQWLQEQELANIIETKIKALNEHR